MISSTRLAATASIGPSIALGATPRAATKPFTLRYAPHLGMFRHSAGSDPVAQIDFMADQGFTAFEDNPMRQRSVEDQDRIAGALRRHDMAMGVFVLNDGGFGPPLLAAGGPAIMDRFLQNTRDSIEVAARVGATWMTVVPGTVDASRAMEAQTASVIEVLKRAAALLEPHGLAMVLEPLNPVNHAGQFLVKTPQADAIVRAVDSPACRILYDIYHQQISEGDLIRNMGRAWDRIAMFQVGDNPGRKEPGTGEINYRNVFAWIHEKGYDGILGMEHGNSRGGAEGERAVIDAYLAVDP